MFIIEYFKCFFNFNIGCKSFGMYGSNCDIPCPVNCKYNTCHIQLGTCFGCKPGWIGTSCNISMYVVINTLHFCINLFDR